MQQHSKAYFPHLDALRFIAFLCVFFTHSFATLNTKLIDNRFYIGFIKYMELGALSVNFFFILSSFLITWILFEEQLFSKNISLKNFYIRRILRIWPLYYLIAIAGLFILPLIKQILGEAFNSNANTFAYLFFFANISIIHNGPPYFAVLAVLWTISVEEQFYICWPIIVKLFNKYLPMISLGIIALSVLFRAVFIETGEIIYFHTLSVMSDIAIGSLLAYVCFFKKKLFFYLKSISQKIILGFYIFLAICIVFYYHFPHNNLSNIFERLFWGIVFAYIIFEQCFSPNSIFKAGSINKRINYLGKISYGLYAYHAIANLIIWQSIKYEWVPDDWVTVFFYYPVASLLLTIIVSHFSYQLYEKYFLQLKGRFSHTTIQRSKASY